MTNSRCKYILIFSTFLIFAYGCSPAASSVSVTPDPLSDLQPTQVRAGERAEGEKSELRKLMEANEITLFMRGVNKTGLTEQLKGPLPTTFFVPSDSAFQQIPAANLKALKEDENFLKQLLVHHMVTGRFSLSDLEQRDGLTNNLGEMLFITIDNSDVLINGARIIVADIEIPFGVIHVIDKVLSPP